MNLVRPAAAIEACIVNDSSSKFGGWSRPGSIFQNRNALDGRLIRPSSQARRTKNLELLNERGRWAGGRKKQGGALPRAIIGQARVNSAGLAPQATRGTLLRGLVWRGARGPVAFATGSFDAAATAADYAKGRCNEPPKRSARRRVSGSRRDACRYHPAS